MRWRICIVIIPTVVCIIVLGSIAIGVWLGFKLSKGAANQTYVKIAELKDQIEKVARELKEEIQKVAHC